MGFWNSMKRMAMGEPVFQPGDQPKEHNSPGVSGATVHSDSTPNSSPSDAPVVAPATPSAGPKVIPEVEISDVECHESDDDVEVWVTIHNPSPIPVFLDKITFLGQKIELDYELSVGGARQSRIYRGDTPHSGAYNSAELDYRAVSSGDYFRAKYFVEYNYESNDNTYLPKSLKLQRPVRDV
jgi:hypothetical protein